MCPSKHFEFQLRGCNLKLSEVRLQSIILRNGNTSTIPSMALADHLIPIVYICSEKNIHHHIGGVVGRVTSRDPPGEVGGYVSLPSPADNLNDVVMDVFPLHI